MNRSVVDLSLLDSGPDFDPAPMPTEGVIRDKDGCIVPSVWHGNVARYEKVIPLAMRQRSSASEEQRLAAAAKKALQAPRAFFTRFTTDYAIEWGQKQTNSSGRKWTLIDRERYDWRLKRHHDLEGGVDAIFDDQEFGRVGVQGAGRGERKEHWDRFVNWGGVEKANRRNLRVFYLEFVRGNKTPVKVEQWAPALEITEDAL